MCGFDELMGMLLADFARNVLGAHRAAVVYEVGRAYSVSLARSFLRRFADDASGRTTAQFVYLSLQTDFRPQLKAAAAFHPDVLFLPGSFTDATLVAMQAEGLGFQATLLGGDGWSSPLLFKRGGPHENAYYGNHCRVPERFAARYSKTFGETSEGCRALLAHDAIRALAAALQEMGPVTNADLVEGVAATRERLRVELAQVQASGESGPIRFDERGDVARGIAVTEVVPGAAGYAPRHLAWLRADQ
jgi:branched-chain amino acid transport system substrate-binding protein